MNPPSKVDYRDTRQIIAYITGNVLLEAVLATKKLRSFDFSFFTVCKCEASKDLTGRPVRC